MPNYNQYEYQKYRDDKVFEEIHREYLTIVDEERKTNNYHLKAVIEEQFIPLMRQDKLFDIMYKRIVHGGSFYKGTKYGEPEEFDLNFVLKLPIDYSYVEIDTNHSDYGFAKIKVNLNKDSLTPEWEEHEEELSSWFTRRKYFNQNAFRGWIESVFIKAYKTFSEPGFFKSLGYGLGLSTKYEVRHRKSGPAFTLMIETPEETEIDVDLVPVFEFDQPLGKGYKRILREYKKPWRVVGKPLPFHPRGQILWRLCFYDQEKEFLRGEIKPVIRMMKKFRDKKNWKSLASYYIETVFYHELERHKNDLDNYLKCSKTFLFMTTLKKLRNAINAKRLPYFWHPQFNLFERLDKRKLQNYANDLDRVIAEIDEYIESDPWILAEKVLTNEEYDELTEEDIVDQLSNLLTNWKI